MYVCIKLYHATTTTHLRYRYLGGLGTIRIEISCSGSKYQVAIRVPFPSLIDTHIRFFFTWQIICYEYIYVYIYPTLMRAKSPEIDSSITKLRPSKVLVSRGGEDISTTSSPVGDRPYLIGNPPCWIMVPYAVLVKNAGMPAPRDMRRFKQIH